MQVARIAILPAVACLEEEGGQRSPATCSIAPRLLSGRRVRRPKAVEEEAGRKTNRLRQAGISILNARVAEKYAHLRAATFAAAKTATRFLRIRTGGKALCLRLKQRNHINC